jgi:hypothetical protein
MSVFDFFEADKPNETVSYPDRPFEEISETEMVSIISEATGLTFEKKYLEFMNKNIYETKLNKATIDISYSRYSVDDKRMFISVNYNENLGGFGCPCDTFQDAIKRVNEGIKRATQKG